MDSQPILLRVLIRELDGAIAAGEILEVETIGDHPCQDDVVVQAIRPHSYTWRTKVGALPSEAATLSSCRYICVDRTCLIEIQGETPQGAFEPPRDWTPEADDED